MRHLYRPDLARLPAHLVDTRASPRDAIGRTAGSPRRDRRAGSRWSVRRAGSRWSVRRAGSRWSFSCGEQDSRYRRLLRPIYPIRDQTRADVARTLMGSGFGHAPPGPVLRTSDPAAGRTAQFVLLCRTRPRATPAPFAWPSNLVGVSRRRCSRLCRSAASSSWPSALQSGARSRPVLSDARPGACVPPLPWRRDSSVRRSASDGGPA